MAVTVPRGWSNFSGGGSDPTLCGEDENGNIPLPSGITPVDSDGLEIAPEIICANEPLIRLRADGGVPPFTWFTTAGVMIVTGPRTATLALNAYSSGPTVHCGAPLNVDRNAQQAYVRLGAGLNNNGAGFGDPCSRDFNDVKFWGISYNCLDEELSAGDLLGGALANGYILVEDDFPTLCQQTKVVTTEPDCGFPFCAGGPWTLCNSSTGGDHLGNSEPVAYLLDHPDAGNIIDARTPEVIANGCAPCSLLKGSEIVVQASDALGRSVLIVIEVN